MTLQEKEQQLLSEMGALVDPQSRLAFVVERGRKTPRLPQDLCVESNRVEGCLSNLWFMAEYRDGICFYRADSDSAIVRGIAVILCEFYSGASAAEIFTSDPSFLARVGITQHLSPNRRNALSRLWERIREFAERQI